MLLQQLDHPHTDISVTPKVPPPYRGEVRPIAYDSNDLCGKTSLCSPSDPTGRKSDPSIGNGHVPRSRCRPFCFRSVEPPS